jgi:lipid A 4'-phosphatase
MSRTASPRRDRQSQGLVLGLVALIGTVPFWLTDLDIRTAALFYQPDADDHWQGAQAPLWSFLYMAAPLLVAFVMLGGLFLVAAGAIRRSFRQLRCYAVLLIAATLLGPGLLVNVILKDNWGRPRPHQIEQLGGTSAYLPPLALSRHGEGKSFPSGHSSVGFMLGGFFMIWLRRRPLLAWVALSGALILGTLLGIGRMAAGDHFLSDIIWSGVIAYGVVWVLYYFVLDIPKREAAAASVPLSPFTAPRRPKLTAAAYGGAAVLMVAGVSLATPLKNVQTLLVRPGDFDPPPRVLRLIADQAEVFLFAAAVDDLTVKVRLQARGFGLPWSRVAPELTSDHQVLTYRVTHEGHFTEKDTRVAVGVVPGEWDRVEIRIDSGDIRVYSSPGELPEIDLHTGDGEVIQDNS